MNSKRMRFGFLVLAVYALLGVIGVYSQSPTSAPQVCATDLPSIAKAVDTSTSNSGGDAASVEWHSFLPGAFK